MTLIQLTQFVICMVHAIWCGWFIESVPRFICALQMGVMCWMLFFFVDFFKKAYFSKGGAKGARKVESAEKTEKKDVNVSGDIDGGLRERKATTAS